MSYVSLRTLEPWLIPWAEWLTSLAPEVRVTSTRRSRMMQAMLYRRYLNGQSSYPAAPPGYSKHEYGRAFDLAGPDDTLAALGEIWERYGGTWGGRGGDPIHFEV